MQIETLFSRYHLPEAVRENITKSGITSLYPPQAEAIAKGVLQGNNLLLCVPTAAGKTLVAEFCMLKSILENRGRCLYIVPLKALASEKYADFKQKYSSLGIRVGIATGDLDSPNHSLNKYQILVATAEKVDSLLRFRAQWLINALGVAVLDEIHFLNDESRGPTLEILAARIKQLNPRTQILALSATVYNAAEMAQWLKAELVQSDWRPIPLKEGVYYNQELKFQGYPTRLIREEAPDDLSQLTLDTLRSKGQVLVFVSSRRSAQAASRQLCPWVAMTLTGKERQQLALLSKQAVGSSHEATKICRSLGEGIRHGVAFHHAGLKPQQRQLIEENFKKNLIKAICSTPTLAAGVNLPARRAIIRDCKRFESGLGAAYIPTFEYKQCAGRAGRPQYDVYGEAVLMAKSASESRLLFDRYINADPEPITSKLGQEHVLRLHILASIAGGYVHDVTGTFDFLSHTFLAHQKQTPNLLEIIGETFDFLDREGFIEKNGFRFQATAFGECTSRLYIDPVSALILRDGLQKISMGKAFSSIGLLHLCCCCPDSPLLNPGRNDTSEIEEFASCCQDELIMNRENLPLLDDFVLTLSILKTTMMLTRWIEEEKEERICDVFGIGPGDIYRHIESIRWILHAGIVFADLFRFKKLTFLLAGLEKRVQYGIKEELVLLAQLRGIGRVRARQLFQKGFKRPSDLKHADPDEVAAVPSIGKAIAKSIIEQATHPLRRSE